MTALAFLSSGIFLFLVALSFCRGVVYLSTSKKRYVVSGRFLGYIFVFPPVIYFTLFLIILFKP